VLSVAEFPTPRKEQSDTQALRVFGRNLLLQSPTNLISGA